MRRRLVYIDAGSNWGDTLEGYVRLDAVHGPASNWEIYAFEASPLLMPHVDGLCRWRNDERSTRQDKPVSCIPPVGSTHDLMHVSRGVGCHSGDARAVTECVRARFDRAVAALSYDANATLFSRSVVESRLNEATTPNERPRPRFTFVPAAVGGASSSMPAAAISTFLLHKYDYVPLYSRLVSPGGDPSGANATVLEWVRADSNLRRPPKPSQIRLGVPVVDLAAWIATHFVEDDHVVLKLDTEGAEFDVINRLIDTRAIRLIDMIAYECHPWPAKGRDCSRLAAVVSRHNVTMRRACAVHGCDVAENRAFWGERLLAWRRTELASTACAALVNLSDMSKSAHGPSVKR